MGLTDIVRMVEYEDHIDNLMGRLDTRLGNTDAGLSFRYATRQHDGITGTNYTGAFKKDHQSYGFTVDLGRPVATGVLDLILSVDRTSDSLDSETSYFTAHEAYERTELQYEGAFGDMEQQQTRIALKPKWSLDPINLAGREHTITVGGGIATRAPTMNARKTLPLNATTASGTSAGQAMVVWTRTEVEKATREMKG